MMMQDPFDEAALDTISLLEVLDHLALVSHNALYIAQTAKQQVAVFQLTSASASSQQSEVTRSAPKPRAQPQGGAGA